MTRKKQGDLRLLKDGVVFGPTDRDGLERMLQAGRLRPTDFVSVRNADWLPIAGYLAAPPPPDTPPSNSVPANPLPANLPALPMPTPSGQAMASGVQAASSPARKKRGALRVLSGGRVISSLTRDDVELLWTTRRLDEDDLISAAMGPWMRVGDFFAPPPPPIAAAPTATPHVAAVPPAPSLAPAPPVGVPTAIAYPSPPPPPPAWQPPLATAPVVGPPPGWNPPPPAPQIVLAQLVPQPASPLAGPPWAPAGYPLARVRPPSPRPNDEWFVRVRGIHSAPLKKHHVKALYQAREVTLDCVARHPSWHENDWRPIHSIPELADISRP